MAHGSKRWLTCYDGHVKKSNDRTKKDYYRGLKRWEPYSGIRSYRYFRVRPKRGHTGEYCPQCKHNYKAIKAWNDAVFDEQEKLHAQWDLIHKKEIDAYERAVRKAEAWNKKYGWNFEKYGYSPIIVPDDPRSYRFRSNGETRGDFVRKNRTMEHPIYHEETYLCPKHRRDFDVKWSMWDAKLPGWKARYQYTVRQDYKNYKGAVNTIMQKAKYDEEYYDDIPKYKRSWLD